MLDTLSNVLEPYKDVIGLAAGITTVFQFLSGIFVCRDIMQKKSSNNFSIIPFLGGIVIGILSLQFGLMIKDDTMIAVNIVCIILNIIYMYVFIKHCDSNNFGDTLKNIAYGGAFTGVLMGYTYYEDPEVIEFRFGMIVTALLMILIASPLFSLNDIIKKKSTEGLPFPMILSGSVVGTLWLLYGISMRNNFVIAQNVVGCILCYIQLALFAIYPDRSKMVKNNEDTKKSDETKKVN